MIGQINLFENKKYEYWKETGKAQPESIKDLKLIKAHISATHIYYTCPTCKCEVGEMRSESVGGGRHIHYLDEWKECEWCGQRLSWDWDVIESQSYYINMIKKRDAVVAKEKSETHAQGKKDLKRKLENHEISLDEYKLCLRILEAETLNDYETWKRLQLELKQLKVASAEKEKRQLEYKIARNLAI